MIDPIYPAGRTKFRYDTVDFAHANNSKNPESKIRDFTVSYAYHIIRDYAVISINLSQAPDLMRLMMTMPPYCMLVVLWQMAARSSQPLLLTAAAACCP